MLAHAHAHAHASRFARGHTPTTTSPSRPLTPSPTQCSQQRALPSDTAASAFSHMGPLAGEFPQGRWHFYGCARAAICSVRRDRAVLLSLRRAPSRRLLGVGGLGGLRAWLMPGGSADVQRLACLPTLHPNSGLSCWANVEYVGSSAHDASDLSWFSFLPGRSRKTWAVGSSAWTLIRPGPAAGSSTSAWRAPVTTRTSPCVRSTSRWVRGAHRASALGPWHQDGWEGSRRGEGLATCLPSPSCSGGVSDT